jgi:cell wall assembly regulator SMI1
MEKLWQRIESWLKQNAPDQFSALQPGASDADIKKAEEALSCELPGDVKESYRIHDGIRAGVGPLVAGWRLLSLATIVKEWQALTDASADETLDDDLEELSDPQIKSSWWNPLWIPVASNSSGDFICVDLDPQPIGNSGQVISFLHADPARKLLARDLKSWLDEFAGDLEAGKYKLEDEWLTKTE